MTARSVQIATRAELLSREDFIEYVDSVFAEIQAEALRDAADRAVDWMNKDHYFDPPEPFDNLRAAILADRQEGKNHDKG